MSHHSVVDLILPHIYPTKSRQVTSPSLHLGQKDMSTNSLNSVINVNFHHKCKSSQTLMFTLLF